MRGTKRPIEGQVVDSGEPAYYVEAMPRWRRLLVWSARNRSLEFIIGLPAFAALGWAAHRWGWVPLAWLVSVIAAYAFGWNMARRYWLRDGYIDDI